MVYRTVVLLSNCCRILPRTGAQERNPQYHYLPVTLRASKSVSTNTQI